MKKKKEKIMIMIMKTTTYCKENVWNLQEAGGTL